MIYPREQFSGRSFGFTPARGIRAFFCDSRGRLFGAMQHVWTPEEQKARCSTSNATFDAISGGAHDMKNCTCGFYAYADGISDYWNEHGTSPRVHGIIDGYGKVSFGSRGFRSSKARLVAIALPESDVSPLDDPTRGTPQRVAIEDHFEITMIRMAFGLLIGLLALVPTYILLEALGMPTELSKFTFFAGIAVGLVTSLLRRSRLDRSCPDRRRFGFGHRKAFKRGKCACAYLPGESLSPDLVAKIRRNYPDVEVYPTLAALIAAYPPDPPETKDHTSELDLGVAPDVDLGPDADPLFWSRPVAEN